MGQTAGSRLKENSSLRITAVELVAFFLLLLGLLIIAIRGSLIGGVSVDVQGHYAQLSKAFGFLRNPSSIPELRMQFIPNTRTLDDKGNAFFILSHLANVVFGNEVFLSSVSSSHEAVVIRNLLMVICGLCGAVAASFIVWLYLRSVRLAGLTFLVLLAIPIWTSSLFINPRDPVVGAGYTMITACLIYLSKTSTRRSPFDRAIRFGFLTGGIFLSVGSRLSLWPVILFTLCLPPLLRRFLDRRDCAFGYLRSILLPSLIACLLVILVNPQTWRDPLSYAIQLVLAGRDFSAWGGHVLLGGKYFYGQNPPWFYFPLWIAAQTPLIIGALLLLALFKFNSMIRTFGSSLLLLLCQGLLIPALLAFSKSTVYNGSRHVLFVYPVIAVFGVLGLDSILRLSKKAQMVLPLAVSCCLIIPILDNALLFPYGYTYINPLARVVGTEDAWELDYFGLSSVELAKRFKSKSPSIWPASDSPDLAPHSIRWFDPNIPPAPIGCNREYVNRKVLLSTFRFAYFADCSSLADKSNYTYRLSCPTSRRRLACDDSSVKFHQTSTFEFFMSRPLLIEKTYGPSICISFSVLNRSPHFVRMSLEYLTLTEDGQRVHRPGRHSDFDRNLATEPHGSNGWMMPLQSYGGPICFDFDSNIRTPDERLWELKFKYKSDESTLLRFRL